MSAKSQVQMSKNPTSTSLGRDWCKSGLAGRVRSNSNLDLLGCMRKSSWSGWCRCSGRIGSSPLKQFLTMTQFSQKSESSVRWKKIGQVDWNHNRRLFNPSTQNWAPHWSHWPTYNCKMRLFRSCRPVTKSTRIPLTRRELLRPHLVIYCKIYVGNCNVRFVPKLASLERNIEGLKNYNKSPTFSWHA